MLHLIVLGAARPTSRPPTFRPPTLSRASLLDKSHRDLEQLETGRNVSLDLQLQISQNLNALARELHELERLLPGERNSTIWRRKIVELQEESRSQRAASHAQ